MLCVPHSVAAIVGVDVAGHLGLDGWVDVHVDELDAKGLWVGSGMEVRRLFCDGMK